MHTIATASTTYLYQILCTLHALSMPPCRDQVSELLNMGSTGEGFWNRLSFVEPRLRNSGNEPRYFGQVEFAMRQDLARGPGPCHHALLALNFAMTPRFRGRTGASHTSQGAYPCASKPFCRTKPSGLAYRVGDQLLGFWASLVCVMVLGSYSLG